MVDVCKYRRKCLLRLHEPGWVSDSREAGAYTRPLLSSTSAVGGLMTQETLRLTIDLSRAKTLQGLTLVHFSAQPQPFLS